MSFYNIDDYDIDINIGWWIWKDNILLFFIGNVYDDVKLIFI